MKQNGELEAIGKLETLLGKKLPKVTLEKIRNFLDNGYCLDAQERVTGLNLDGNKGFDITLLRELPHLSVLSLIHCELTDLSPLSNLTQVTKLVLHNNQLTDLSPLANLTQVSELYLRNNQLTDLSPLSQLTRLTTLNICNNQIKHLPQWATAFKGDIKWKYGNIRTDDGLYLKDNPFETPPIEVIKAGKAAVINYFKELAENSIRFLHAKMLLVGQGEVGKTTIMKKLMDPNHTTRHAPEPTTEGIDIQKWSLDGVLHDHLEQNITIHFWDFGGQEIYHSTHQFFLTKRSLYLFIWEARKEEEASTFDYWLEIVKLLGENSPVIIVMNKADVRVKHIDEKGFKEKYPNIRTFLHTSCTDGSGFPQLRQAIRDALAQLPHLNDQLPKVWLDIRNTLEEDPRDYISLDEYYRICETFGLDGERADFLSQYLHDLGVILHFRRHRDLEHTVILKPQWATHAVYKLLDTKEVIENCGSFQFDDLKRYWDQKTYPPHMHLQLVRLMERFELCFQYTDTDRHFVPELLPPNPPDMDTAPYRRPDVLRFQYDYPFMPGGIISRFISRLSYLIHQKHSWKYGVELRFETTTALVRSEPQYKRITVAVVGPECTKLLGIIQTNLDHIHQTLNMVKDENYDEMIPCICRDCKGDLHQRILFTPQVFLFKHKVLKRFLQKGRKTIPCNLSAQDVSIAAMLNGLRPPQTETHWLPALLHAAGDLQGLNKTIRDDEDSRTNIIRKTLSDAHFEAREQARWGKSETGKSSGRVDLLITHPQTGHYIAVEAFNLKYLDTTSIHDHLERVFYYDPQGGPENVVLIYAMAADFNGLWQKYLEHIAQKDFAHHKYLYPKTSGPHAEETHKAELKHARTVHMREGTETTLHHVFVNMRPAGKTGE